MAIVNDHDLLLIEPSLFVDAGAAATILTDGSDGAVLGTTFSSMGSNFISLQIDAGHVIVIDDEAFEVIERISMTTLSVSAPRADQADPLIAPDGGTALPFAIPTFARTIDRARAWTLGAMGIDPGHPVRPLDETSIVNVEEVTRFIALRSIHEAFAAASALDPAGESLARRASLYQQRSSEAMHSLKVLLDLDGDGIADATRRIDAVMLLRT